MRFSMLDEQFIRKAIDYEKEAPEGVDFCAGTHGHQCNRLFLHCIESTVKASYRTYAFVYLVQLLVSLKQFRQRPKEEIPKFLFKYLKSVSFTAVDMAIMRRVLCWYNTHCSHTSTGLIPANILGGLYLAVESKGRQVEIALYALNKTIETLFNMHKRRNGTTIPHGEVLLFAVSISVLSFHYFNNKELMKSAYQRAFGWFLKDS